MVYERVEEKEIESMIRTTNYFSILYGFKINIVDSDQVKPTKEDRDKLREIDGVLGIPKL